MLFYLTERTPKTLIKIRPFKAQFRRSFLPFLQNVKRWWSSAWSQLFRTPSHVRNGRFFYKKKLFTKNWHVIVERPVVFPYIIQGVQQYGNKLVLGLRNFPLDPYIIWKLQSWGFRIHRRSFAERLWSAFRTGRNIMAQPQNFAGLRGCDIADSSGPLIKKRIFWMPKWENFI